MRAVLPQTTVAPLDPPHDGLGGRKGQAAKAASEG